MIYLLALIPATMLTIAGYFVAYLSLRSEGTVKTFGRYLSFWAYTLAGLVILAALFAAAHGHHHGMHGGMDWHEEHGFYGPHGVGPPGGAPPAGAPPPGAPAPGSTPPPQ
jgi:hypothetical protein